MKVFNEVLLVSTKTETIQLAVTVKAYPNPSQSYGETVCVAGIRTDGPAQWVRLYPVQYRDLPEEQQFKKWHIVEVDVVPHSADNRLESKRPIADSYRIVDYLKSNTQAGLNRRRELVEAVRVKSMCELQKKQKKDRTSLGVFRPKEVLDLEWEDADAEWDAVRQGYLDAASSQQTLWGPSANDKTKLERIPVRYRYNYTCADVRCRGHRQSIIDWELGQSYRLWRWKYGPKLDEAIRTKFFDEMCGKEKDTHLIVGNMAKHAESFLVLGVFWPKKV